MKARINLSLEQKSCFYSEHLQTDAVLVVLLLVFSKMESTALCWTVWLPRHLPGCFHPCLRRAVQGHTAQPTSPMPPLPLPLRGWGLMSQTSSLLTLPSGKHFPGMQENLTAHTPKHLSWTLTWLTLGWQCHFHRVWFAPAPTKRRNSNNPRWVCLGLLFLCWSLSLQGAAGARPFPGRCH